MIIKKYLGVSVSAALLGLVTACTEVPYVHNNAEFNRDSIVFRTGVTDRGEVVICHSRRKSQNPEIERLASEACRQFGKKAVFAERSLQYCPLVSPFASRFHCRAPGEPASNTIR